MKKFLLFLMLLVSGYSYALTLPAYNFQGSVLCEDLKVARYLPDSLQGHDFISSSVSLSDTSNDIFISYYFETSNSVEERPKTIYTDLNENFKDLSVLDFNTFWGVYEIYFLNGVQITESPVYYFSGLPASECYEAKKECPGIKVYRKSIRSECRKARYKKTELHHKVFGDSVFVEFKDSIGDPEIECLSEALYLHIDSGVISHFQKKKYELIKSDTFKLCLDFNCKNLYVENEFIRFIDLNSCVVASEAFENESSNQLPYPNPATDVITIPDYSGEIELTNLLGAVFKVKGNEKFRIAELPQGVYVISTTGEDRKKLGKILIQ